MDKQTLPEVYAGWLPDNRRAFVVVVPSDSSHRITVEPRRGEVTIPPDGAIVTSDGFTVIGRDKFPPHKALMPGNMNSNSGHSFGPLAAILPSLQSHCLHEKP